jgi:broad specificity phosphatase PhoE/ubiquinone/menaquinone biosynthesis C-methylase UbiE
VHHHRNVFTEHRMTTPESRATHMIFVRHGQSLYNRDGDSAGEDSGLTELGWRQAHLVADWLARRYPADALVSSTLIRSRQTAEVISQRTGLPMRLLPGLEETEQPYWDELPFSAADPLAPWDAPWQPTPAVAPIYIAFRARLRQALAQILADYAGQTVIIISHGGSIGTILRSLCGGHHMAIYTENAAITQLAWHEGHWRLIESNTRSHLASLEPAPAAAAQPLPWAEDSRLQPILDHFGRVAGVTPTAPGLPTERDLRALIALAAPSPTDRLLDMGTGTGAVALAFAPHVADVIAVDVSPAMLERAERARLARKLAKVYFRWTEATQLPFEPASFDLVTSHNLLQYIADPAALLAGFRRVLTSGGRLVLDEVAGDANPVRRATQDAIEARRDPAFVRSYSLAEMERLIGAAGFRIGKTEAYDAVWTLDDWLDSAAANETTRTAVRAMLEASIERDAAGLQVRRGRDDALAFAQHRVRLLTIAHSAAEC